MPALRNNFDGGPDGTTITPSNSGQVPGNDPFDSVSGTGTGVIIEYTSADIAALARPTAEYVMQVTTGAGTGTTFPCVRWTTSMGPVSEYWTRFYVYFSSVARNTNNDLALFSAYSSPVTIGFTIFLQTTTAPSSTRTLTLYNHNSGLHSYPSTLIAAGQWYRIEVHGHLAAGSTSQTDVYLYGEPDSDTYTELYSQTAQDYGGITFNNFALGEDVAFQTNTPATYFSSWELNDTNYPGPAPFRPGKGVPGILTNPVAIHMN